MGKHQATSFAEDYGLGGVLPPAYSATPFAVFFNVGGVPPPPSVVARGALRPPRGGLSYSHEASSSAVVYDMGGVPPAVGGGPR